MEKVNFDDVGKWVEYEPGFWHNITPLEPRNNSSIYVVEYKTTGEHPYLIEVMEVDFEGNVIKLITAIVME